MQPELPEPRRGETDEKYKCNNLISNINVTFTHKIENFKIKI